MDKEVLEILKSMQDQFTSMQDDMRTMQNDMRSMQGELKETNRRLERVENKTDKNTLILEDMSRKLEVVAEVQSSFTEQLDRTKDKDEKSLADKLNIIELAVTDTSSRVKNVQKDLSRIVRVTADNWAEIAELKSIR
jgi:DNA repair ATPase RecN